jgi:hypothetical protein
MYKTTLSIAVAILLNCAGSAAAQTAAVDPPSGGVGATPPIAAPSIPDVPAFKDNEPVAEDQSWRYVRHGNAWWFWLPSNEWVVWNEVRWVAPRDMPPRGWNPLFYVPQFDRPYPGAIWLTPQGIVVLGQPGARERQHRS